MKTITLALVIAAMAISACTSSPNDAIVRLPVIEAGAAATPPPTALDPGPALDERDESDNQLALIDDMRRAQVGLEEELALTRAKLEKEQKRARLASEVEEQSSTQLEELQSLVEQSSEREQAYQRQVILARLDALKKQRELIQREIDVLASGQEP